jgi:two-component system sensor histidine kinase KdpD
MDVDAILARKPAMCVVDELAHTNVAGSRHEKRYQDVLDLLDAGIGVMTAVNIQHLETLNDAVSRVTGVRVRETIPDTFLDRADEIANVDATVEELHSRLRQGKVYKPEKVEQALANFFRESNISTLRELALRAVADEIGDRAASRRQREGLEPALIPDLDVADIEAATKELEAQGYRLLVSARREPWGQTVTRFLSPEGMLVGISHTPWLRGEGERP